MESKRPGLLPWLCAGGAVLILLLTITRSWLSVLPIGVVPTFFDLDSYRDTLNAVVSGALMYDWLGYPPVTLILLSPLRGLPELAGDRLWTGASIILVLVCAAALSKLSVRARPASPGTERIVLAAGFGLAGTLMLLSEPVTDNFVNGQLTLLVVTLALVDVSGALPRRWQGTLVGLAAAFKLTPLIFFPYYLITRQWRQAGIAAASFAAATGVGFALFPRDSLYFWTHTDSSGRLGADGLLNLSILGALSRWMADPAQAKLVWVGLALVVGLAAFWRAWKHFSRNERVEAALVIGCASTAISPIAWPHYLTWLVLAAVWLLMSGSRRPMVIGALMLLLYCPPFVVAIHNAIITAPDPSQAVVPRLVWELIVVVPTLVCLFGLPHRAMASTGTVDPTAPATATPAAPQEAVVR